MAHRTNMWLIGCFLGLSLTSALVQSASYSSKHNKHSTLNASQAVFEARGDVGGGGGGYTGGSSFSTGTDAAYGAPSVGAASYDSYSIGGGGGGGGGYGAPAATAYKYQIYPAMQMGGGGWGWGGGGGGYEDDDDFGLDKELIGLLGLKGLKGLKGLAGLLPLLKGLLLLKKIGLAPLLLLFSPILLPLFLFKLALLLLPLLLLLLIPIPVITTGRQMFERATGKNASHFIQDTLDDIMTKLPDDLNHIISKIKNKAFGTNDSNKSSSKDAKDAEHKTSGASHSRSNHKSIKFVKPHQQTSSSSSSSKSSSKSVVPTS